MIQKNRKYHKNERLIAYMLLVIFVCVSIQLPLLNQEVYKNDHITGYVLVGLQESINANSIYKAPTLKFGFGQYKVVSYFHRLLNVSLFCFNRNPEILQKLLAGSNFPRSSIPSYIFDRVLRI